MKFTFTELQPVLQAPLAFCNGHHIGQMESNMNLSILNNNNCGGNI